MKFDFDKGITVLKRSLKHCPRSPGVYQFFDSKKKILYVGKAKNLFNRLSSYTNFNSLSNRIKKMIGLANDVIIIKTPSEIDALLLESNLIKSHKPTFNIRLIDDKSFPFILISQNHNWPRLEKYRGNQSKKGFYFGPFASVGAVNEVMTVLEKGFLLRTCTDSVFENRKRPCLLYEIKRCSAPCVNLISKENYKKLIKQAILFLDGKDTKIKKILASNMSLASKNQRYEEAALYRDRIKAITKIYQKQNMFLKNKENFDVICVKKEHDLICIQCFFIRNGQNLGNKEYFFHQENDKKPEEILEQFISLFYLDKRPPNSILINKKIENTRLIELSFQKEKNTLTKIVLPKKGKKMDIIKMAEENIKYSIAAYQNKKNDWVKQMENLRKCLFLSKPPKRIEIYDNSHLSGTNPVGAMVVYDENKFNRSSYRKFNIKFDKKVIQDDYFMMRQVLTRRLSNIKNSSNWKSNLPDLIIIDGGKGHLNVVQKILKEKKLNNIDIIAMAKGKNRNSGQETIYKGENTVIFKKNDTALYFLQRLRDEAHRFAVSSQRYKRKINMKNSVFDKIDGLGSKSKTKLLEYFGSIESIKSAGIKDLESSPGIGKKMAKKIYNEFNDSD